MRLEKNSDSTHKSKTTISVGTFYVFPFQVLRQITSYPTPRTFKNQNSHKFKNFKKM
ncbi:hypothetical protein LEP1GSC036_0913 [Leptospira weilii str. 2006001853]|uniref:Uncharacterized protein n=1 Tax=Leptospira weilii str. 2006001853 TaxID=1001589 RepID=A0A828YY81_9LEPT|nr:hypothetical protein LEP1GSC036_0913 [Leptospira weilii str. 2006001853]EMN45233.1 hypothetical protein LEP1GSC086_3682 [Leptospira weilii str. LNT 1234]